MQVQITAPIHGAVLNRHDGRQDGDGLHISVQGVVSEADTVTVSGGAGAAAVEAAIVGATFRADFTLDSHETVLTAVAERGGETATHAVTVLWDRNSFPRYRFSLDDDIYFLRDIAVERPKSIFDTYYLGFMRDLRDKYGTKTHINIYYACEDFDLRQMPDTYKSEWRDNADWLQLSFHARADQPRDPYKEASAEKAAHRLPPGARRGAALCRRGELVALHHAPLGRGHPSRLPRAAPGGHLGPGRLLRI